METLELTGADDAPLAAYRWPAANETRGIVLIVHGMAEHARRYERFACTLAETGRDVYSFDLRGHGATTAPVDHGYLGTNIRWQTLIDDVTALRALALSTSGKLPVVLFGHSLGSFIAQGVMQVHGSDYAAVVLSGTDKPGRMMCHLGASVAGLEAARVDATGRSAVVRALTFGAYEKSLKRRIGTKRTPFDWLSSQPESVDAYIDDPAAGFDMRTSSWQCLLRGIARVQSPHARRKTPSSLPLLIAAGSEDPMGGFGRGPRALAAAYENDGQRDVTLCLYDGARHELLHDTVAASFTQDMLAWMSDRDTTPTNRAEAARETI